MDSLKAQLEGMSLVVNASVGNISVVVSCSSMSSESRRRINQLQQEKLLAVQRLQTLQQIYLVKIIKVTPVKMTSKVNE